MKRMNTLTIYALILLSSFFIISCVKTVKVTFISDPNQATINIHNEQGVVGTTPLQSIEVKIPSEGDHVVVEARKDRFKASKINITSAHDNKIINFVLEPENKLINFYSNVKNTEIYIDNVLQGVCGPSMPLPLTLTLVDKEGRYKHFSIYAKKLGWEAIEKTIGPSIEYMPGEMRFELSPEKKSIVIESEPSGANIYLNGERINDTTPSEINLDFINDETLELTKVKIEISKNGYESVKGGTDKAIKIIEYTLEKNRKVLLKLKRREEVQIPGVEILLMPKGAAFGIRSSRSILNPSENSPAVSISTRLTQNSPMDLDQISERLGVSPRKLREIILTGDIGELHKILPPLNAEKTLKELLKKYLGMISSFTISPDGNYLVFSEIEPVFPEVHELARGARNAIFGGDDEQAFYKKFTWGGDLPYKYEDKLVFNMKASLKAIGKSGGGITTVTNSIFLDKDPAFTADGKYIYFSSNRDGEKFTLWRVKFEPPTGTGITRITSSIYADHEVDIRSIENKEKIVYSSLGPTAKTYEQQIWTANLDGTLPTQFRYGFNPKWSPNGEKIVYSKLDSKTGWNKIWLMNEDGSEQTQMTFGNFDDINPGWSPDGNYITYSSTVGIDNKNRHNYDIWIMKSDGTTQTQLTTNGSEDIQPVWSPDRKYIYFISNRGGAWNLWRVEPKSLPN